MQSRSSWEAVAGDAWGTENDEGYAGGEGEDVGNGGGEEEEEEENDDGEEEEEAEEEEEEEEEDATAEMASMGAGEKRVG